MHAIQAAAVSKTPNTAGTKYMTDEEESVDPDEPPDPPLQFSKVSNARPQSLTSDEGSVLSPQFKKASLLTQALTSPELTPLSDADAPHLTSDGGFTSPARTTTPSPPLPALGQAALPLPPTHDLHDAKFASDHPHPFDPPGIDRGQESKVEEGLGRRRCISFACSQKTPSTSRPADAKPMVREPAPGSEQPSKRPCVLRFACPAKPTYARDQRSGKEEYPKLSHQLKSEENTKPSTSRPSHSRPPPAMTPVKEEERPSRSQPLADRSESSKTPIASIAVPIKSQGPRTFNRIDFQKSEATRFHEFAGSFTEDDEWIQEQTAYRRKITIDDTLRKENAIRKIAEEAETEALEEEEDGRSYSNEMDLDEIDEVSDGGNETDDEEGFADSDDESDFGSSYQFWTPGLTTAATSAEHMDQIRPMSRRLGSESSIESILNTKPQSSQGRRSKMIQGSRSGSPSLPDSSDFVVGTIDEDRQLEERYANRRKRREQQKQKLIPQDIDPSFPNSDPEADNDEDEDEEEELEDAKERPDEKLSTDGARRTTAAPSETSDNEASESGSGSSPQTVKQARNSPPKRLRSPPPQSRRLFNQPTHRLRSPPPMHRKLTSPPSSRRPSPDGYFQPAHGIPISRLAQRPNLTHTTSLPRTPNPFWVQHRKASFHASESPSTSTSLGQPAIDGLQVHSRGPIDIVQGLEAKRQRRKEKFWRQHTRIAHAGKEKERKCQPGKGVQRMREVGLEMADRFKGYRQETQLVLSV